MKILVRTSLMVLVTILVGFVVLSCSSPNNNGVSQGQIQQAFEGFASGAGQVSSGGSLSVQPPPPEYIYTYTLTESGGGSITLVLKSTANIQSFSTSESGNFAGSYITFTNFSGDGYTFNGTVGISGGFSITTGYSYPYLCNLTYDYSGSVNVSGAASFTIDFSFSVAASANADRYGDFYSFASGPTYSGTVSANGQTYNIGSLSANVAPMSMGRLIFGKK